LVVDIDGTLVNSSGDISVRDREAIARTRDSGISVSLSTGRGVQATLSIIKQLSLDSYHMYCDGALVSSPSTGQEIHVRPISQAVVRQMAEFTRQHEINLELFTVTHYFVERETWSTEAHRQFFGVYPTIVDFTELWAKERVIKGGLVTTTPRESARAEAFRRHFDSDLHFSWARTPVFPGVDFVNILSPGVSKGKALEALVSHLGVSLAEVIAIGDGTNDISLLASAGTSVAMGNAPDEVKAVADHVTLDVDHSGLAAAIDRFLL